MTDRAIPILQGEFKVSDKPGEMFTTILGSCISVCLYDPLAKLGGMNHYLLAQGDSGQADLRYGAYAIELLINGMLRTGASKPRLVAKLFGGAGFGSRSIGQANARFAVQYLADEGIPCVADSLGGERARRLHFWPATGAAKMLFVPKDIAPAITQPAPQPAKEGTIELF